MAFQAASTFGTRQAEALVDLGVVAANLRVFASRTSAAVMAVVKADAYGHGARQVARTALNHGATWLGVSFVAEALALREAHIDAPILTLMHTSDTDLARALSADVDISVASVAQLEAIADCATRMGKRGEVHLKADTGLRGDGASSEEWPALVAAAAALERRGGLHVRGICTQLIHPEDPDDGATVSQVSLFESAALQAEAAGLTGRIRHLAGSTAVLWCPDLHYEMVRVGSGLYGLGAAARACAGVNPAMSLMSRVITARRVSVGDGVSDGHRYRTREETMLGLVPIGFADGIPQPAAERASVWIDGRRRPIAGRVAMNSIVVDLGAAAAEPFGQVLVFGPGGEGEPTAADWADWAGTSELEILTGVSPLLPRSYVPAPDVPAARWAAGGAAGARRSEIVVLFGGPGGEYEISCDSAASILTHLDRDRYEVRPVRITPESRWVAGPVPWPDGPCTAADILAATGGSSRGGGLESVLHVLSSADVVIPVLHGPFGEDGTVQALMDALGVRYVGSGVAASAAGMDKDAAKRILSTSGLDVARWAVLRDESDDLSGAEREELGLPVFVKPARSGSSVGVSKLSDWSGLGAALAEARGWDRKVLVESAVVGHEVTVAVLEYPDGRVEASRPARIDVTDGRDFLDYGAKYDDAKAARILIPAPLNPIVTERLRQQAVHAFQVLGCRGLARVDFLIDGRNEPVFNEINTFPGFGASSLYPLMWAEAGVALAELLNVMIRTALATVGR